MTTPIDNPDELPEAIAGDETQGSSPKSGSQSPGEMREAIARAVLDARDVLVTGHRNPDGDSMGSILALGLILGHLGKSYTLYGPDPVAFQFRGLPLWEKVQDRILETASFDLVIAVDTGDESLLGPLVPPRSRRGALAVIDHHASSRRFGDLCWRDPSAAAAGVLVAGLAETLQVPMTAELAAPLWCALYTDTGGFRYSSTDAQVLRLAARLVESGLSPWDVSVGLYEQSPLERIRLMGLALSSLSLSASGQIACLLITEEMLWVTGADHTMLDGIINYARGIAGVEVAVQILQQGDKCRVGLRSKGRVDVGLLALGLGGGGHSNAAGCVLPGTPAEVEAEVMSVLEAALAPPDGVLSAPQPGGG
ncbi:MAG: DHH family phosphoesterase [Polyangia bacterium]|nr:DHH family phosphoesterase [Polyangia bacterium]